MRARKIDRSLLRGESFELFSAAIRSPATRDPYERKLLGFLKRVSLTPDGFAQFAKENPFQQRKGAVPIDMTNLSTKIATAISILSIITIGTTAASSPVQGQLSVEPQPENMSSSAANMTSLNITATGANTTTTAGTNASAVNVTEGNATITNTTAGYFCYNCANATSADATTSQ